MLDRLLRMGMRCSVAIEGRDERIECDIYNTRVHDNEYIVRVGKYDIAFADGSICDISVVTPSLYIDGYRRTNQ